MRSSIELANIRSLIARLTPHDQDVAQQLVCSLARYHHAIQTYRSGIEEVTRAVMSLDARTSTRVVMLTSLADLHLRCVETAKAADLLEQAASLADDVGAPEWNDAAVDRTRGEILLREGMHGEAILVADLALNRGLSLLGQARMRNLNGIARYEAGDFAAAFERCRASSRSTNNSGSRRTSPVRTATSPNSRCTSMTSRVAATHQQACLDLALEIGQPVLIAFSAIVAARLAARNGDWVLAVRLQSVAERELAAVSHTMYPADQAESAALRTSATAELGEEAVAAELGRGAELGVVAAAALAADVFGAVRSRVPDPDATASPPHPPTEGNP